MRFKEFLNESKRGAEYFVTSKFQASLMSTFEPADFLNGMIVWFSSEHNGFVFFTAGPPDDNDTLSKQLWMVESSVFWSNVVSRRDYDRSFLDDLKEAVDEIEIGKEYYIVDYLKGVHVTHTDRMMSDFPPGLKVTPTAIDKARELAYFTNPHSKHTFYCELDDFKKSIGSAHDYHSSFFNSLKESEERSFISTTNRDDNFSFFANYLMTANGKVYDEDHRRIYAGWKLFLQNEEDGIVWFTLKYMYPEDRDIKAYGADSHVFWKNVLPEREFHKKFLNDLKEATDTPATFKKGQAYRVKENNKRDNLFLVDLPAWRRGKKNLGTDEIEFSNLADGEIFIFVGWETILAFPNQKLARFKIAPGSEYYEQDQIALVWRDFDLLEPFDLDKHHKNFLDDLKEEQLNELFDTKKKLKITKNNDVSLTAVGHVNHKKFTFYANLSDWRFNDWEIHFIDNEGSTSETGKFKQEHRGAIDVLALAKKFVELLIKHKNPRLIEFSADISKKKSRANIYGKIFDEVSGYSLSWKDYGDERQFQLSRLDD